MFFVHFNFQKPFRHKVNDSLKFYDFKEATKLYSTHYSCVVIILSNRDL